LAILRDPVQEETRLRAIERYEILDAPREETFDRIVAIASALFGTAMAVITVVDRERSWHVSEKGMGVDELPRANEMCDTVIAQDGVFVVNDALEVSPDIVQPLLDFGIRFYVGAPLRTHDGVKIGTLCAIDPQPHQVTETQKQILVDLCKIVIDEMELRLAARRMAQVDEELRDLNQQLEISNRNKSEFLASMSHELRTPLNGILGASELLSQGLFGDLTPKQQEYLEDIHQSGRHLLGLIDDVLDLSRIEAGQVELRREVIDAADLMQASAAVVRGMVSSRALELEVEPCDKPLPLNVDERRIVQVACNLLSNALKFSPPGGRVRFRASSEDADAVFAVEDEGPGIPVQLHERIFEQFFRAAGDQDGTGLGLPVARRLVELHGGRIWLESRPDAGSTFYFSLPLHTNAST
jgi:signal transduction histidine kinase